MQSPKTISALALQLATAHRASRDGRQRRRLADAFLLLEDYLYDQGMQAGTGSHWKWWYGGQWADAVYLMRDVLAEAGRLPRQCDYFLWNWGGAEIFAETDPPSYMDFYTLDVPRLMRACLMQPEVAEQVRWLRAFKRMLERSILQPTSALKIDGCAYHHGGHYFHYAFAAVPALAATLHELSGTPWRLDADAHERVRRALLAQRLFCNQRDMPLSLSGRMPFVEYSLKILPQGLDCLARSGTPDAVRDIDPLAAAAYLRLAPEAAKREPYRSRDIGPEPEPNGCFVMPYAALVSHRRDNWLASVHGQSKYVWGTERQSKVNCFGLFQGLGHLEILAGGNPVNVKDSGEQRSGWDWRRFEGTTVPQFPLELIDKKWTTAYSPETFAGGLAHRGQGIFAMIVNQPRAGREDSQGAKELVLQRRSDPLPGLRHRLRRGHISNPDDALPEMPLQGQERGIRSHAPRRLPPHRLPRGASAGRRAAPLVPRRSAGRAIACLPGQKVTLARRHQTSREYQGPGRHRRRLPHRVDRPRQGSRRGRLRIPAGSPGKSRGDARACRTVALPGRPARSRRAPRVASGKPAMELRVLRSPTGPAARPGLAVAPGPRGRSALPGDGRPGARRRPRHHRGRPGPEPGKEGGRFRRQRRLVPPALSGRCA